MNLDCLTQNVSNHVWATSNNYSKFDSILLNDDWIQFQQDLNFGNQVKNVWAIQKFVAKAKKNSFCQVKKFGRVQEI